MILMKRTSAVLNAWFLSYLPSCGSEFSYFAFFCEFKQESGLELTYSLNNIKKEKNV